MNMIVNKSDLVGYEAVDRTEAKKKALAKIVAAWESKQAKNATRWTMTAMGASTRGW